MSASQPDPPPILASEPVQASTPAQETNPIREAIAEAIAEHRVILFMKDTPEAPACGFSARTVAALQDCQRRFAAVDVLPDPRIRQELSSISNWPTIPQLFIDGELVGGCDIITEMYQSGELAHALGLDGEPSLSEPEPVHAAPLSIENRLGAPSRGSRWSRCATRPAFCERWTSASFRGASPGWN